LERLPVRAKNPDQRAQRRDGVALLEAIVALTIVTVAVLSAVTMVRQGVETVRRAEAAEVVTTRASAFMEAIVLWPRADLDRHLGNRAEGPWRLDITRPTGTLYLVALSDSGSGRELIRTAIYRPEPINAP
jgi:hypothetical protein